MWFFKRFAPRLQGRIIHCSASGCARELAMVYVIVRSRKMETPIEFLPGEDEEALSAEPFIKARASNLQTCDSYSRRAQNGKSSYARAVPRQSEGKTLLRGSRPASSAGMIYAADKSALAEAGKQLRFLALAQLISAFVEMSIRLLPSPKYLFNDVVFGPENNINAAAGPRLHFWAAACLNKSPPKPYCFVPLILMKTDLRATVRNSLRRGSRSSFVRSQVPAWIAFCYHLFFRRNDGSIRALHQLKAIDTEGLPRFVAPPPIGNTTQRPEGRGRQSLIYLLPG